MSARKIEAMFNINPESVEWIEVVNDVSRTTAYEFLREELEAWINDGAKGEFAYRITEENNG